MLTLAFGTFMLRDAAFLNNSSAPYGLLSLQMTYTEHDARSILSSWSQEDARHAALSLYWDMGFAIAYGLFCPRLREVAFAAARDSHWLWLGYQSWQHLRIWLRTCAI